MNVLKTFSLTLEHINILKELSKKSDFNDSKLIREFIDYFKANSKEFQKIIDGDYGC